MIAWIGALVRVWPGLARQLRVLGSEVVQSLLFEYPLPAGIVASLYLRRELPGEYRPLVAVSVLQVVVDSRPVVAAVARQQPAVVPLVVAAAAREIVAAREVVAVVVAREVQVPVRRVAVVLHREPQQPFQDFLLLDSHLPCYHVLRPLVFSTKTELTLYAAQAAYSRGLDLIGPDWLASSGASVRWTAILQVSLAVAFAANCFAAISLTVVVLYLFYTPT